MLFPRCNHSSQHASADVQIPVQAVRVVSMTGSHARMPCAGTTHIAVHKRPLRYREGTTGSAHHRLPHGERYSTPLWLQLTGTALTERESPRQEIYMSVLCLHLPGRPLNTCCKSSKQTPRSWKGRSDSSSPPLGLCLQAGCRVLHALPLPLPCPCLAPVVACAWTCSSSIVCQHGQASHGLLLSKGRTDQVMLRLLQPLAKCTLLLEGLLPATTHTSD